MSIRVSPDQWGSVFAVPSAVVDEHIRMANGQQLKVLLYVLRHSGEDLEVQDLSAGLGMSEADVSDAMQYWLSTGFLTRTDLPAATSRETGAPKPYTRGNAGASPKGAQKALVDIPDNIVPTYETVAARLLEDETLKGLFREVQARMGKTIGYDTQAKLLMMHDTYGLPPEVILTIVEYSVNKGKGPSYMCKVAKNWAEEGITTLEDAMEKLEQLARTDRAWTEFVSLITVDPPKQTGARLALVHKWRFTFGQSPELMFLAYEKTLEAINKQNFNYMDKMLTRWNEEGLRTPQDVLKAEKSGAGAAKPSGAGRGKGKGVPNNHAASYDSEAYRQKASGPITYKRKDDKKE